MAENKNNPKKPVDIEKIEDLGVKAKKDGYYIKTDILYFGKYLKPGERNKLAKLKEPEIADLLAKNRIGE